MNLNEYIKQSYKRPNKQILETLGASETLIDYVMETPGNTNISVVECLINGGTEEIVLFEGELVATQKAPNGWGTGDFSSLVLTDTINNGDMIIVTLADETKLEFVAIEDEYPNLVEAEINLPNEITYYFHDGRYDTSQYSSHDMYINGINTGAFTVTKIVIKRI